MSVFLFVELGIRFVVNAVGIESLGRSILVLHDGGVEGTESVGAVRLEHIVITVPNVKANVTRF